MKRSLAITSQRPILRHLGIPVCRGLHARGCGAKRCEQSLPTGWKMWPADWTFATTGFVKRVGCYTGHLLRSPLGSSQRQILPKKLRMPGGYSQQCQGWTFRSTPPLLPVP